MKKLNVLTAAITSAALLFGSFGLISCSSDDGSDEEVTVVSYRIASEGKNSFLKGEAFSSEGLKVVEKLSNKKDGKEITDITATVPEVNVDTEGKLKFSDAVDNHSETVAVAVTSESIDLGNLSYDITITEQPTKIKVVLPEEGVSVVENGTPDYSAVKVYAVYAEATEETEEDSVEVTDVTFSEINTETIGTVTVTVTYMENLTAEFEVTVTEYVDPNDVEEKESFAEKFKRYFVTTDAECTTTVAVGEWGSGSSAAKNDDGTWTITCAASMWGGAGGFAAPFTGLEKGMLAGYSHIVVTFDVTNFEGAETSPYQCKVPETQLDFGQYLNKKKGNLVTFAIPMTAWTKGEPANATEFAFVCYGSGSIELKELFLAADDDPSARAVTSIEISPASKTVEGGAEVTFTVKDSNLNDVTSDCIFTIEGDDATGSSVTNNKLTAGTTAGTVKVRATYTNGDGTFTSDAEITVMAALTNLINTLSVTKTEFYYSDSWAKQDDVCSATVNEDKIDVVIANNTVQQWQAQITVGTDADVAVGDAWYFSCKISGTAAGKYTIKLNNDETLISQQIGEFTAEGTIITCNGTVAEAAAHTDMPIMIDLGGTPAGSYTISDIVIAKTN